MMSFPKGPAVERYVDEGLLAEVRKLPCIPCSDFSPQEALQAVKEGRDCASHPHHLKTRKSGGGDHWWNVIPLCWRCHTLIHQRGTNLMARTSPAVRAWLLAAGWQHDPKFDHWRHP